ncbi:MAG: hypothetical protein EBT47_04855 [Chloroflexi bacterium]|nr:hypothetical protein [Chloroflexota bacterium]
MLTETSANVRPDRICRSNTSGDTLGWTASSAVDARPRVTAAIISSAPLREVRRGWCILHPLITTIDTTWKS